MIYTGRKEAQAANERFYYPARPCKHHHEAKRYAATGACVTCQASFNAGKIGGTMNRSIDDTMIGLLPLTLNAHPDDRKLLTDLADALALARHIDRAVGVAALIGQARAGVAGNAAG